jgi:hypothetical protein
VKRKKGQGRISGPAPLDLESSTFVLQGGDHLVNDFKQCLGFHVFGLGTFLYGLMRFGVNLSGAGTVDYLGFPI